MVDDINGVRFLKYPRFVQIFLDDKIKNLPKDDDDELVLEHMDNETLKRLQVYKNQKDTPPGRKKFATIANLDYGAPPDDKCRHDNSGLDTEDKRIELLEHKRSRWFLKDAYKQKKKRTPKAAPKRTPKKSTSKPHLVDEPPEDDVQAGGDNVEGGNVDSSQQDITVKEIVDIIAADDVEKAGDDQVEGVNIDEEDASYEPTAAEKEKLTKDKGRLKRKSQPSDDSPKKLKPRKTTATTVKVTLGSKPIQRAEERVETSAVETPVVEAEIHIATPPRSPIHEFIPIQTEEVRVTPSQQHQEVPEPSSMTKKNATPRGFEGVDDFDIEFGDLNLGSGPVPDIEDLSDIPSFGESERFKQGLKDLNKIKLLQMQTFDQIGIRRAEVRRIECERRDAEEAAEAAKDKGKGKAVEDVMESSSYKDKTDDVVLVVSQFNRVGTLVTVQYSKEETSRRIEVEHHMMKSKKYDKKEDKEDDEEEDSDDVFQDIDDYHFSGDDNDDDGQGGNDGALIVRPPGSHEVVDYLDDSQNEQHEDVHPQGESTSGATPDESVNLFSNTPKVIYLNHDVKDGELVENWIRETMMEALGINDENFKFDIEDEIPTTTPDSEYVFMIEEPFHYSSKNSEDFPTFEDLEHNQDDLRRKVDEKVSESGTPRTLTREELREERKKWFKPIPEERKFKRPLKFFTRQQDQSPGDILSWGYLEDLKVYAIKREYGVQYFKFICDLKKLPWWDVEKLVKIKNIQQCLWGPEVRFHEQKLWAYIKDQAEANFPVWKPRYPKQVERIDHVIGEKDIMLHVKCPGCMKNMPLKEMEQGFYKDFK
ncbi:hypothetical protein Hanom_Chr02g00140571 [Helianthus anomalus]